MNTNDKSGMTIVEVLVSVVIISLVMSLLFTLLIQVQNANSITTEKSSLLISQAVITKTIEQDFIETGIKSVTRCSFSDFNHGELFNEKYDNICLRVEYNLSYDISDVGYLLIYKQVEKYGKDPKWIIRYSRGYYQDCGYEEVPNSSNWVDTYTVVQKLEVTNDISLATPKLEYSADYDSTKKYSMQKNNSGQLVIPIMDSSGYHYNIDVSFSYKLFYDSKHPDKEYKFYCDNLDNNSGKVNSLDCVCHDTKAGMCDTTYISNTDKQVYNAETNKNEYKYTCSETKFQSGIVTGIKTNVLADKNVSDAGIRADNVREVAFFKELVPDNHSDYGVIDVSTNKNRSTLLYYKSDGNFYTLHYAQEGGVTLLNPAGFFSDYTELLKVNFENLYITGNDYSDMFRNCYKITKAGLENFGNLSLVNATSIANMFYECRSLTESPFTDLHGDAGNLVNVTNASGLFLGSGIEKMKITNDDYSTDIRIPNVQNISEMFSSCLKLKEVYLSGSFNKLVNMDYFTLWASRLEKVEIIDFNAPNLTSAQSTFRGGGTSSETSKSGTFKINMSNVYTPSLKNINRIFADSNIGNNTLRIKKWNLTSVEDISYMFANTIIRSCGYQWDDHLFFREIKDSDNSSFVFNPGTIKNASHLFYDCVKLDYVEIQYDIFKNVTDLSSLFEGCTSLKDIYGTNNKGEKQVIISNDIPQLVNASKMYMLVGKDAGVREYNRIFDDNFFNNCKDFSYMFMNANFNIIKFGGINSSVELGLPVEDDNGIKYDSINLSYMFSRVNWDEKQTNPDRGVGTSPVLTTVEFYGASFKAILKMTKMFYGQSKLSSLNLGSLYKSSIDSEGSNKGYLEYSSTDDMFKSVDTSGKITFILNDSYIPGKMFDSFGVVTGRDANRKFITNIENTKNIASASGKFQNVRSA